MLRNPWINLLPVRQNDENAFKGPVAAPLLQADDTAFAYPDKAGLSAREHKDGGAQSDKPLQPAPVLRRSRSNRPILSERDASAADNAFLQSLQANQNSAGIKANKKVSRKKSLGRLRPTSPTEMPALPANAAAIIAQFGARRYQEHIHRLQLSLELAKSPPKAHHWLTVVKLEDDAPNAERRAQASKARQLLQQAPNMTAPTESLPLFTALPAFKFARNAAINNALIRKGKMAATTQIREMFGTLGYFMVTNSLAQGGFGKFRIAMDLNGKRYAVKELRTLESEEYEKSTHPSRKPAKTCITSAEDIEKEINALLTYASGVTYYDEMMWRGKLYIFLDLMKGDAENIIYGMRSSQWESSLFLAVMDVSKELSRLHTEERVVHRDFKWANVLVSQEGKFHVSDFGLTERLNARGEYRSDILCGTHFAPESAVPKKGRYLFTPASDIFALGVSLGSQLLPELNTPLWAELNDDNTLGLVGKPRGFYDFADWWSSLLDASGHVAMEKLTPSGDFGNYFSRMAQRAPSMTYLALNFMLAPNPADRATAAQLADYFAVFVQEIGGEKALRAEVAAQPYDAVIERATSALDAYGLARRKLYRQEGRGGTHPVEFQPGFPRLV